MSMNEKIRQTIMEAEQADNVILESVRFNVSDYQNTSEIKVTALVGNRNPKERSYTLRYDTETDTYGIVNQPSLYGRFKYEYNLFQLDRLSKEEIFVLLTKANDRRKTVERNMRKYAKRYYKKVHEHYDTLQRWKAERQQWKEREWEIQRKENDYKQWRDHVDELVNKENQQFRLLYSLQECSCCKEKRWRKKYRETYNGMSEFCGKYINIVDDMMRQENLPDNVKARLCDMRIAFIESREFLDKVKKDESAQSV